MIWFLCALMLAAPARTSAVKDRLQSAEKAFDRYEYAKAVKAFEKLLADPAFVDAPQRQLARLLLSFSLFLSDKRDLAAQQLAKLFAENADYPIDRDDTNPDLLSFFDGERNKIVAATNAPTLPASEPVGKPEEIIAVSPTLPAPAPEVTALRPVVLQTAGDRHPWVRIFPAGIGHFANHDFAGGAAFLSLEAALLATHLTFGILHKRMLTADGLHYTRGSTNGPVFQIITNVAGIAAIALALVDILDAFIWSPARGRATLAPTVSLGPLGDFTVSLAVQ